MFTCETSSRYISLSSHKGSNLLRSYSGFHVFCHFIISTLQSASSWQAANIFPHGKVTDCSLEVCFFLFLKYLASWLWTYSTYWVMSAALCGRNLLNYRVNVRKRTVFFFSLFQIIYCCVQWLYMWQYCTWKWHCIHSNIVSCNRTSTFNVI